MLEISSPFYLYIVYDANSIPTKWALYLLQPPRLYLQQHAGGEMKKKDGSIIICDSQ